MIIWVNYERNKKGAIFLWNTVYKTAEGAYRLFYNLAHNGVWKIQVFRSFCHIEYSLQKIAVNIRLRLPTFLL